MQHKACCFLGHRETRHTEELEKQVYSIAQKLVLEENVDTFLFGSKSRFNSLCYEQVTKIKEKYPHIKRIYVRAEFPYIDENYKQYLLKSYEDTYYPPKAIGAGRAAYVERNREMIDKSKFCVIYYQGSSLPEGRKSGTKVALEYARKKGKILYVLP